MENASKALIMAAGVLISLVIIGAFMLMMSNLTDYQEKSYQSKADAQTVDFNNQYITYDRENVRGSDMVSLMNKIIDYNSRKEDQGYTPMEIEMEISSSIREDLTYDGIQRVVMSGHYTEDTIDQIVGQPEGFRGSGTSGRKIRKLEEKYQQKYIDQLANEISTIKELADVGSDKAKQKFVDLKLLPINDKNELAGYGGLSGILEDAVTYYEYIQFKRTTFDCTGTEYDENTGRIIKMEFECTGIGV